MTVTNQSFALDHGPADNRTAQGSEAAEVAKFTIQAVKGLCRQEQEDWWEAISTDRVGSQVMYALKDEYKTFEHWAEMAAWPGYDVNVVYGQGEEKLAIFWTCGKVGHGGFLHFSFLEAALPLKLEIGRHVLKVLWACGYKCLASLTPAARLHVIAYAKAMGGKVMGIWPGVCYIAADNQWVDGALIQFLPTKEA